MSPHSSFEHKGIGSPLLLRLLEEVRPERSLRRVRPGEPTDRPWTDGVEGSSVRGRVFAEWLVASRVRSGGAFEKNRFALSDTDAGGGQAPADFRIAAHPMQQGGHQPDSAHAKRMP